MLQLLISYWDLLFHRQIATPVAKWAYDQGALIFTDKSLAISFFLYLCYFIVGYLYLYLTALNGICQIPGMEWLTDSVAFGYVLKLRVCDLENVKKKKMKPINYKYACWWNTFHFLEHTCVF
jgi:hypothetical protein